MLSLDGDVHHFHEYLRVVVRCIGVISLNRRLATDSCDFYMFEGHLARFIAHISHILFQITGFPTFFVRRGNTNSIPTLAERTMLTKPNAKLERGRVDFYPHRRCNRQI